MRRLGAGTRLFLLLLASGAAAAAPAPFRVLAPADGERRAGDALWLVVRSARPPQVALDGQAVAPTRSDGKVHHWRLQGLRPEGSRISVEQDGQRTVLAAHGRSEAPALFHARPAEGCAECHSLGEKGCTECHRWPGGNHAGVLAEGCLRCHEPPAWRPRELAPLCGACHPDYAAGKHPRLRHPLTSARDPLRPGRKLDCASCHDPHAPRCLGCLGKQELREWCKECHGRP